MLKRFIILLTITLGSIFIANAEHLQFMGIPINGTINTFQQKLLQKGCKISPFNNYLPAGTRAFTGTFGGKKANIYVYFNVKTKNVFACRVAIDGCFTREQTRDEIVSYYKRMLKKKYADCSIDSDIDGYEMLSGENEFELLVWNPPVADNDTPIGLIQIFIGDYESDNNIYPVLIHYEDAVNSIKNEDLNLQDF